MNDHLAHSKVKIHPHKEINKLFHLLGPQFPHIQDEVIRQEDL